jgi:cytochrome c553
MTMTVRRRLVRFLLWPLAGLLALAAAGFLVAWSGVYNIAASRGHWAVVEWFLAFGMRNSVELRALAVPAPPVLDNPDLIRLGAGHFHSGCAFCHGAPGIPVSPIAQQMLPSPPHLATAMRDWKDEELLWIVKHGIKYTGMPGWVALERDDEIWSVVAFLRRQPHLDPAAYRDLALGGVRVAAQTGEELATEESNPQGSGACARCHGAQANGPASTLVPVLHGQPVEFLAAALKAYADGTRRSGIMQPMAADLQTEDMERLARYYAGLAPPKRASIQVDQSLLEHGRRLALEGDRDNGIPACNACHAGDALALYPRLAGQHAAYMAGQLRLWKAGHNASSGGGAIMAPIAQRLSSRDIEAATAFFASHPPTGPGPASR